MFAFTLDGTGVPLITANAPELGTWNGFSVPRVTVPEYVSWSVAMRESDPRAGEWLPLGIPMPDGSITLAYPESGEIEHRELIPGTDTFALDGWVFTPAAGRGSE